MNGISLRQLRYFDAVARHGHFGRAAEACAISQPALSLQIRELEEHLGLDLFERGARRIRLTGFGEAFVTRARQVLRQVEEMGDFARSMREELSGPVRLGIIPTIAPYLLPGFIATLMRRYPRIDLTMRETLTPRLIDELDEGRIDAAILALPVSEPGLTAVPLFTETFMLVRPLGEAGKPVPDGVALSEMRLLLLEEGHCFRDQALAFCNLTATRSRDMLDATTLSTLVQMVGAGLGVTLVPEMAVAVETRSAPVSVTAFAEPQPRRVIGMVWRKTNPLAPQFACIAEVVLEAAGKEAGMLTAAPEFPAP